MAKILVLYYSSYGHVEQMARAVAGGAGSVEGVEVTVKRVPELVPDEVARGAGMKLDQEAPVADPNELADYDGVIFGVPTRFGEPASLLPKIIGHGAYERTSLTMEQLHGAGNYAGASHTLGRKADADS